MSRPAPFLAGCSKSFTCPRHTARPLSYPDARRPTPPLRAAAEPTADTRTQADANGGAGEAAEEAVQTTLDRAFLCVYACEMLLKLLLGGTQHYCRSPVHHEHGAGGAAGVGRGGVRALRRVGPGSLAARGTMRETLGTR